MILLPIAAAVILLILLITLGKVPPFVAFIVSALAAALLLGMPLAKIPGSIEHGIGDLLGDHVVEHRRVRIATELRRFLLVLRRWRAAADDGGAERKQR